MPKNMGLDTRTMFLACSEAELEFHFLKYFLTSYSPSTQFLAFRSIWGFWKWSQMIPHIPKHWFCHQNHVSSMLRSWVRISLLEVLLDLLQPLHPVLGLQVDLRLLNIVSKDSLYSKHGADYVYGLLRGRVAAWSDPKPHMPKNQIKPTLRSDPVCCPRFSPKWMLDPEFTSKTGPENGLRREGYPLYGTWQ